MTLHATLDLNGAVFSQYLKNLYVKLDGSFDVEFALERLD